MNSLHTIVFFNSNKAWGGGEKWHLETALWLMNRGYTIHVAAHPEGVLFKQCQQQGIPVSPVKISKLSFLNPFEIRRLKRMLIHLQADTIILNLPSDMKAGGLAARQAKLSRIFYRRGTALAVNPHPINRYFFSKVIDAVIANSEQTKHLINKKGDLIDKDKIHVVYNGVPDVKKSPKPKADSPRFIIGNAGRFVTQKGQDLLIPLARSLSDAITDFEIHLAGDGPQRNTLKAKIKKAKLEDHIKMSGFIKDISTFYSGLHVFVLPSRWEGFGYVLAEAMLHEIPVIAFDVSSNPEIITDGETGFLIPFGDLEKMKERILYLYHEAEARQTMGKQAREDILTRFAPDSSYKQLEKLINRG
ncbi:MAG: glycosyltransferase [Bacteroidales bacterium]